MKKPNVIIHLDVTPEESLRRIKMRSRGCETGITIEYLRQLRDAYDDFIRNISLVIPVIRVPWSEFRSAEVRCCIGCCRCCCGCIQPLTDTCGGIGVVWAVPSTGNGREGEGGVRQDPQRAPCQLRCRVSRGVRHQ